MTWTAAKSIMGDERVLLGPQAAHQWQHDPRHLLFVLARYKHAARFVEGALSILELGCGEGIGARILTAGGASWHGVDLDADALAVCIETLPAPRYRVDLVDAVSFVGDIDYGAVVSLDVIEHIPAERENAFMVSCAGALSRYGACVIGTPNATAAAYQSPASRAAHVNLYDAARLERLMRRHFRYVTLFGMSDETLTTGYLPTAHYLLALGVGPR